jgi:Transcriptional regulator
MNTHQLKCFVEVAECGSMTRAAERLMISPPALSCTIARLEQEMDAEFFLRTGRQIQLSDNGRIMLRRARTMLCEEEACRHELSVGAEQAKMGVTLGISSPIIGLDILANFTVRHPDITLDHRMLRLREMRDPEITRSMDFIIAASNDLSGVEWDSSLLEGDKRIFLAVPSNNHLAKMSNIRLVEAADERFIQITRGYSFREYTDTLFQLAGFEPNTVIECEYDLRTALVSAGYGVMITTGFAHLISDFGNVTCVEIVDPLYARSYSIFWHRHRALQEAAKAFLDFILGKQ